MNATLKIGFLIAIAGSIPLRIHADCTVGIRMSEIKKNDRQLNSKVDDLISILQGLSNRMESPKDAIDRATNSVSFFKLTTLETGLSSEQALDVGLTNLASLRDHLESPMDRRMMSIAMKTQLVAISDLAKTVRSAALTDTVDIDNPEIVHQIAEIAGFLDKLVDLGSTCDRATTSD